MIIQEIKQKQPKMKNKWEHIEKNRNQKLDIQRKQKEKRMLLKRGY